METKHTPTPWYLSIDEDTNEVIPDIFDGESEDAIHIAHCLSDAGNSAENAEFIVRAVNAHDELVAALNNAAEFIQFYFLGDNNDHYREIEKIENMKHEAKTAVLKSISALTKARGEASNG